MAKLGRPIGTTKPAEDRLGVVAIRFPAEMLEAIDALREGRLDNPNRSVLIRELLAEAIAARQGKGKRGGK